MPLEQGIPVQQEPFVDVRRMITRPWLAFLSNLTAGTGSGDAFYIVSTADPTLPNGRVLTNTTTVTWDFSTANQAKANVVNETVGVAVDVALTGDGKTATPLSVLVDNVTIQVNGSNQLEASGIAASGYWSELTNGDAASPELVFADGDTIDMFVPT